VKGIAVQVRDAAGNESDSVYHTLLRTAPGGGGNPDPDPVDGGGDQQGADVTAPKLNGFTLPEDTTAGTVKIHIDATDDRKPTEVRTANEDGTWSAWKPYTPQLDVALTDGAGVKGIAVQVRDAAGNESETVYHTLLRRAPEQPQPEADTTAPKLDGFTVPEFADSATINVSIDPGEEEPKEVRFADENGTWGPWQAYKPELAVTLTDGAGVKGVYVQARDAAGNETDPLYKTLLRRA
jgi:hypothetical protein